MFFLLRFFIAVLLSFMFTRIASSMELPAVRSKAEYNNHDDDFFINKFSSSKRISNGINATGVGTSIVMFKQAFDEKGEKDGLIIFLQQDLVENLVANDDEKERLKVSYADFSPNGKRLITTDRTNEIKIWRVERPQSSSWSLTLISTIKGTAKIDINAKSKTVSYYKFDTQATTGLSLVNTFIIPRQPKIKIHLATFDDDNNKVVINYKDNTNEQWILPPDQLLSPQGQDHVFLMTSIKKYLAQEMADQASWKRFTKFFNNDEADKIFLSLDEASREYLSLLLPRGGNL